jgi:hypothetical protein
MFSLTEKKYFGNYDSFYLMESSWICYLEYFILIRFVYWISIYISIVIWYNLSNVKPNIIKLKIINSSHLDFLLLFLFGLFFFLLVNEQFLYSFLAKRLILEPVWHLYFHAQSYFFDLLFVNLKLLLCHFENRLV